MSLFHRRFHLITLVLFVFGMLFAQPVSAQGPTGSEQAATGAASDDQLAPPVDLVPVVGLAADGCLPTRRSSPFNAPICNDVTFVVDQALGLDTNCRYRSSGPLTFSIAIDRYLGDLQKLQANNLVSKYAILRMPAYDVDYNAVVRNAAPERDLVTFNDEPIGYLTGQNNVWKLNTFVIPLDKLRLPQDGGPNSTLQPAQNTIKIDIDVANTYDAWCTAVDWATLSIEAASPVLAVHGILSSESAWTPLWLPELVNKGMPVDAISLGGFLGIPLDSIQNNASKIGTRVEALRKRWGVDKLNIISHSKGGLDSRHYIESNDTVDLLGQIGTPNAGSPLANYAQLAVLASPLPLLAILGINLALPAGYQLTTPYMAGYNFFHGSNSSTQYVSLAGDYQPDGLLGVDNALDAIIPGPDDSIVPVSSVHALSYASHLTYRSSGAKVDAKHTEQNKSRDVFNVLSPYYLRFKSNPSRQFMSAPSSAISSSAGQSELAQTSEMVPASTTVDTITQGQSKHYNLIVDATSTASFMLTHATGDLAMSLVTPSGVTISADTVDPLSGTFFNTLSDSDGLRIESFVINTPQPGVWTVNVTAPSVVNSSGSETFFITSLVKSPSLSLTTTTDRAFYKVNDPVIVRATLRNDATAVSGATVTATVAGPDDARSTLTLQDTGVGDDQTENDGVYSGRLPSTAQAGLYRVRVAAMGTTPVSFQRESLLQTSVSASTSSFLTPWSSRGVDTDADTLFNTLEVNANLNITTAGKYRVVGVLSDSAGKVIDTSAVSADLTIGSRTVVLSFSGELIYRNRTNGPFTVSMARLGEDTGYTVLPLQEITNAHTTVALAYTRFQRPSIQLSQAGSDAGVDTNENGRFEYLDVKLDVDVINRGSYEWTGLLTDQSGRELAFATNSGQLVAGVNTLTFRFNGEDIARSEVNGPYIVRSLLIFSSNESAVVFEAYTTSTYQAPQFERTYRAYLPLVRRVR